MKVLVGMGIIWLIWCIIIIIMITPTLSYDSVTLDLEDPETYSTTLTSLRAKLSSGASVCGLSVTAERVADSKRFLLVDLKATADKTITLAIDVTNVYVEAYRDKIDNKDRANFFKEAPPVARKNLFKGAIVSNITFGSSYTDLERAAKQSRSSIELGVSKLQFAVESVYGKPIEGQKQAKFLLIAIQMISEAARFKYIENKVVENLQGSFKPDSKVLSLEKNWDQISEAIHKSAAANPSCTTISPPLSLIDDKNKPWTVEKVSTIKPDLGLLKFKKSTLTLIVSQLISNYWRQLRWMVTCMH